MRAFLITVAALAGLLLAQGLLSPEVHALADSQDGVPLPAFTHKKAQDWLNSPPLTTEALRGSVVLLDVWTVDCWNCYRSLPWVNQLHAKFDGKNFKLIGVHSPELPQEYLLDHVKAGITKYGVTAPVMVDNDHSYWDALGNRYWPAFYLVDKRGRIRGVYAGETHADDEQAHRIEADIERLLKEST